MDEPRKNGSILTGCVVLASFAGILLVDAVADRPQSFVPLPAAGRVYAALHLGAPGTWHNWFYYTTGGWCGLSWSLAAVLLAACLKLAADR